MNNKTNFGNLKKIEIIDERYLLYAEDIALCRKYRGKGFKIIYNPTVEIIHHKYKSGL